MESMVAIWEQPELLPIPEFGKTDRTVGDGHFLLRSILEDGDRLDRCLIETDGPDQPNMVHLQLLIVLIVIGIVTGVGWGNRGERNHMMGAVTVTLATAKEEVEGEEEEGSEREEDGGEDEESGDVVGTFLVRLRELDGDVNGVGGDRGSSGIAEGVVLIARQCTVDGNTEVDV